jgi:hypothetical protein
LGGGGRGLGLGGGGRGFGFGGGGRGFGLGGDGRGLGLGGGGRGFGLGGGGGGMSRGMMFHTVRALGSFLAYMPMRGEPHCPLAGGVAGPLSAPK